MSGGWEEITTESVRGRDTERERDYLLHESGQKLLFIQQLLQD
jgi:hypothetical protein